MLYSGSSVRQRAVYVIERCWNIRKTVCIVDILIIETCRNSVFKTFRFKICRNTGHSLFGINDNGVYWDILNAIHKTCEVRFPMFCWNTRNIIHTAECIAISFRHIQFPLSYFCMNCNDDSHCEQKDDRTEHQQRGYVYIFYYNVVIFFDAVIHLPKPVSLPVFF